MAKRRVSHCSRLLNVRNFSFKLIHIISVLIIVIVVHTVMISVVFKRQLSGVNPSVPIR